ESQLAEVRSRDEARRWWERALHHWRLHFARGYLDVLEAQAAIDAELTVAREDLYQARKGEDELAEHLRALSRREDIEATAAEAAERLEQAREKHDKVRDQLRDDQRDILSLTEQRNDLQILASQSRGLSVDEAKEHAASVGQRRDAALEQEAIA